MVVTTNTTLSRSAQIHYTLLDADEAALFNVAAGECYVLNAVATRIWELLEQPMTVKQICARIGGEFEIDFETCQNAVLSFVTEIIDDGIVYVSATETPA